MITNMTDSVNKTGRTDTLFARACYVRGEYSTAFVSSILILFGKKFR